MENVVNESARPADMGGEPLPRAYFLLGSFGQKIGVWFGLFPLSAALVFAPPMLFLAIRRNAARISLTRARAFAFLALSILVSWLVGTNAKPTAAATYLLLYGCWLAYVPVTRQGFERYMRFIADATSILCLIGAAQYMLQFVIASDNLFTWRGLIPEQFFIEMNTLNELSYGSQRYKGNGFFLFEASTLGCLAARVLLLSIVELRTMRYLAPMAVGLFFSLSGTGLAFTALFAGPALLMHLTKTHRTQAIAFVVGLALIAGLVAAGGLLPSEYYAERAGEFSEPGTSGFARFVSPFYVFDEFVLRSPTTFLFGYGPGAFAQLTENSAVEFYDPGWIKLFIELGLVGFVAFTVFFAICVYQSTRSHLVVAGMLVYYYILDAPVLVPQLSFLLFALCVLPVCVEPRPETEPSEPAPLRGPRPALVAA
jgi:hypothetical protein